MFASIYSWNTIDDIYIYIYIYNIFGHNDLRGATLNTDVLNRLQTFGIPLEK